jgi:HEPN domain-containing protein
VIRAPANFIVHTLQQVNDGLSHGRPLFTEIAKDGVILYQSDDRPLAKPKPKTPEQAYSMSKEYFEDLFPAAMRRFALAEISYEKGWHSDAAFDFHQSCELLYKCVLATLTLYVPRSTNIVFLRSMSEGLDRRLFEAWPREIRADRAMFQKLKDGYRKGKYSRHFDISVEELEWIIGRISILGPIVHEVCSEHLAALKISAEAPTKGSSGVL